MELIYGRNCAGAIEVRSNISGTDDAVKEITGGMISLFGANFALIKS